MEEVKDKWMEVSEVTESEQGADQKLWIHLPHELAAVSFASHLDHP